MLSHWIDVGSNGLCDMLMTQFILSYVMVIIALILILVTCIRIKCHDLTVI